MPSLQVIPVDLEGIFKRALAGDLHWSIRAKQQQDDSSTL